MSQGAPTMSTLGIRCALAACVLLLAGCSGGETAVVHGAASVPGVPRDREALRTIESYGDVERSLAIAPGQGFVIDVESQSIGVPFLVDTGSVDRLIVHSADPIGSSRSGSGSLGSAYLVSRSASNSLSSICLYVKERVSIMGEPGRSAGTIDVVLSFGDGYNPIGFVGVCPATTIRVKASARTERAGAPGDSAGLRLVVR